MRRPGSNHITEAFSDTSASGGLIRPSKAKRDAPFSLRLSSDEKARLKAAAGHMALGAYIKARLFEDLPAVPRQRGPSGCDRQLLSRVLALLGQSRLTSNLNQIARAANLSVLPLDAELSADLNTACTDIRVMRDTLLRALGQRKLKQQGSP